MIYLFKVYILVAAVVFAFAGAFIIPLIVLNQAKESLRALRATRLPAATAPRENFVISRTSSRNPNADSVRAA